MQGLPEVAQKKRQSRQGLFIHAQGTPIAIAAQDAGRRTLPQESRLLPAAGPGARQAGLGTRLATQPPEQRRTTVIESKALGLHQADMEH